MLVPVFNEAGNVVPLAEEILAALGNIPWSFEIVFIDDASTDETAPAIAKARGLDARVRGVRHTFNAGQSAALWTGVRGTDSPMLATLDGDRQNDPSDLPAMIAKLDSADLVCGHRVNRLDSPVRKISSRVAFWARRRALGADFQDTGCALRVFRRSVVSQLFPFNGIHRFLPILVQRHGGRVVEVPVRHRPRVSGESKYGVWNRVWRGMFDLIGVAWYLKRKLPVVPLAPE